MNNNIITLNLITRNCYFSAVSFLKIADREMNEFVTANAAAAAAAVAVHVPCMHGKVHVCRAQHIATRRRVVRSTYLYAKSTGDTAFLLPDPYEQHAYDYRNITILLSRIVRRCCRCGKVAITRIRRQKITPCPPVRIVETFYFFFLSAINIFCVRCFFYCNRVVPVKTKKYT